MKRNPPIPTGTRFGRLVVVGESEPSFLKGVRYATSVVVCDCGKKLIVLDHNLRGGHTKSCGCVTRTKLSLACYKHGEACHGKKTRLYSIWCSMRDRCNSSADLTKPNRRNYAARGICVCALWNDSYFAFRKWAMENGYSDKLTIDRIDNNKGYCPDNCRWIPFSQQSANRRCVRILEKNGEAHTLAEWSRITGIKDSAIRWRLKNGWTTERALS